ncbi:hypothetical protein ACI65C_003811 [Semiaphis heraclei]
MEPLMPSEVARLVYGYLKKEKNEEAAECFLKTSPHLTECYQMFKANRNFNIKVNGFNLHDIFDNFGTMCTMIAERIPETCESKTLLEKLQYLLDTNHASMKEDKFVEKKLNMVDKCVGNTVNTKDQSTHTSINIEANKSSSEEVLEIPSFTEMISNNVSKTKETNTICDEITIIDEKNTVSSPCLSSMTQQIENNTGTMTFSKFEEKEPNIFQINNQISSTPAKKNELTKINIDSISKFSPKNIHNLNSTDQAEYQHIPEATSLDSMPGFSKEDRIKDGSVVVDTGELVDTFLNDQSLLEKIADTINKSFEAQKETDNILESKVLDPPTLEKALDSTQSDPQIKNILDEFLVFNVDNTDIGKKASTNDQQDSIKSRLRSARKKDDMPSKLKKNNLNITKQIIYGNEECLKVDNNIVLIHEGNIRTTAFENYDLLSNQLVIQSSDPYNFDSTKTEPGEDYFGKSDYVKIAPKITPMLMTHQAPEKHIFPKRRRQLLEAPGIRSKFRRTNITRQLPVQTPKSIIIEVPNQHSFEIQEKNHTEVNDITRLSEVPSKVNDVIIHDTPDDRLKPPKNKSMSTPRRRSTHIRCLDFSTPQPKNITRSKLFCDTPKKLEKCLEEPSSSPLPKLQADWGSVNGFESMIKKEIIKHWDTDIREMVGAGILTSDADGRKTKKKKTPRKKIKPVNVQNEAVSHEEQKKSSNISITTNELHNNQPNLAEIPYKCDDAAVDVPETPISEIKREYNPSKGVTPLSCISEHDDSLTEITLVKVPNESVLPKEQKKPSNISITTNEVHDNQPNLVEIPYKCDDAVVDIPETPISTIICQHDSSKMTTPLPCTSEHDDLLTETTLTKVKNKSVLLKEQKKSSNISTTKNELHNKQPNLLETPYKCDDAAVDIPETPISKLLREYDPSKMVTPLPCTPEHSNSLTQTSLTKVKNEFVLLKEQKKSSNITPHELHNKQPNLVETPYKCDDAAVDVPETPISKLIREYDPSKMVTPLPCTPEHDDSLAETPLTKVFRETSYLNRPQISPFPPTPGNSMSVDTLIVPPEQDYIKTSNNTNCNMNSLEEFLKQPIQSATTNSDLSTETKKKKIKCTPLKSKLKLSTKPKVKNESKFKKIEAKKKQVYESVKVELFGSDISMSPFKDELLKTNEQHKTIIISKKPQEEEKKSGFKPIPKRKSLECTSVVNVNGVENHLSDECYTHPTNTPFIKPIIVQWEKNSTENVNKTISKKNKKSMVHFDDPIEKSFKLSKSPTLNKSNNKRNSKIQNKTTVNNSSEQLIGLSRYLNNTLTKVYEFPKEKKINTLESAIKLSKLNNSDSDINYSEMNKVDESRKNTSTKNNGTKSIEVDKEKIKLSENCTTDLNKVSIKKENNTVHDKSILPLESIQTMSMDNNISNSNCISENKMNTSLDRSESPIINSSINNTSCVTVIHDGKLDVGINVACDSLNDMEYLKKEKVYEVINEDGEHHANKLVYLNVSESFTFLDIPSELKNVQTSNPIASPSITTNKILDFTSKIESNELENAEIFIPVTSTPKDYVELKNVKDDRSRRSPSFWDDSVQNYPIKHRDDRYWETNRRKNKIHHKYDQKYWPSKFRCHDERPQFDSRYYSQRSHHHNVKREFRDDSVKDKYRSKYKEEKRRSYHDHSKGRNWLEENERFSISQRTSQNELQKLNRSEDIVKKATKRPADRTAYNKTPAKVSKVEHQRLLKNVDVDDFLSVVHGQK